MVAPFGGQLPDKPAASEHAVVSQPQVFAATMTPTMAKATQRLLSSGAAKPPQLRLRVPTGQATVSKHRLVVSCPINTNRAPDNPVSWNYVPGSKLNDVRPWRAADVQIKPIYDGAVTHYLVIKQNIHAGICRIPRARGSETEADHRLGGC